MSELLRQELLDVEVAFRGFGFQESDDNVVPVPFGDDYEWGVFLRKDERRFDLFSAGRPPTASDHYPHRVRYGRGRRARTYVWGVDVTAGE
ncbi:hypothetical protein ABTX77_38060 [Streptomyces sp. NPDC097704]|uniref:hypothetical protein n=1 Tax=Streptomyces sp. NPDC097704 TaxID=3157101 RepID=UPI00332D8A78